MAALALGLAVLGTAAPASALPVVGSTGALNNGGITNCKTPPVPAMPGDGVPGFFDKIDHHRAGTSVYDQYGYAGLTWNTYDIGCVPDGHAILDTAMGDAFLGAAVTVVSAADALHEAVSNLGFLNRLDPLLRQGTTAVRKAIMDPWIGLSLLVLAALILVRSRRGDHLPAAVSAVAWALLVMAVATIAVGYPVRAADMADGITNSSVGLVNATIDGHQSATDPAAARASLVVDDVLYRNWLRGEFGSPDSPVAKKYGRRLLDAQAYTWGQKAAIAKDPGSEAKVAHGKATAWTHWTDQIKKADPSAYWHITGHARGRWGAGLLALFAAVLVLAFLIFADLIVVVALIVFRLGLILLPAIAPIAIHSRGTQRRTVHTMIGGLINAVLYAFGAGLQLLNIKLVLGATGLPEWLSLLLCGVISFVLWRMLRELWHFSRVMSGHFQPGADAAKGLQDGYRRTRRNVGRFVSAYTGSRSGSKAGVEEALEHNTSADGPSRPESYTRPAAPYRAGPAAAPPTPAAGPASISPAPASVTPPAKPVPGSSPPPPSVDAGVTIIPADADLPRPVVRSDPVMDADGNAVHRIWRPSDDGRAPGSYETVDEPFTRTGDADA